MSNRVRNITRCFTVLLAVLFAVEPFFVYAQAERVRNLQEGVSGSFRQQDMQNTPIPGDASSEELMRKGSILTQPTTSGLVYQVHVLGEVTNPGTYRVMASERLAEVLTRAGGVREGGSKRHIEVRRDGKTVKYVDLLKFQTYGQLDHNPYLLDNDVIFIPLKSNTVEVVGAVKRPDAYELSSEKNALAVVKLAGGYSSGVAKNEPVRVVRFVNGEKRVLEINHADDSELAQFAIENGDVIIVPNVITAGHKFDYDLAKLPGDNVFYPSYEDRVFVLGGVNAPGAYPFNPYYNPEQYISLASGYTSLSTRKLSIISPDGKKYKVKKSKETKINPGDTIIVGQRRIPPEGWVNLFMSLAGFGLSTTATVLTLTR